MTEWAAIFTVICAAGTGGIIAWHYCQQHWYTVSKPKCTECERWREECQALEAKLAELRSWK